MANARKIQVINDGGPVALPSFSYPGMPVGFIVTDTTGASWQLAASTATVDHTSVEKVLGNPGLRWVTFTGGGGSGITQLTGDVTAGPGTGSQGTAIAAAAVTLAKQANFAASSFRGNNTGAPAVGQDMTVAQALALLLPSFGRLKVGPILTDASVTINPFSDAAGIYVLPAGTLTANRVLTLGIGGTPLNTQTMTLLRLDTSAFTYTINNDLGAGLACPINPGFAFSNIFYFTGGHFTQNAFTPAQAT